MRGRFLSPRGGNESRRTLHGPRVGGIDQRAKNQSAGSRGLFFDGLFVGLRCGCGGSGSVKVESAIAVRVVPEIELAEAQDRAAVVDGLEGDVLAGQCLAQKEP